MKIHKRTGKESQVNMLAERGLNISYDRLRRLSTDSANPVITLWEKMSEVVPVQAIRGKFTTGGIDNIDYNPSSTTAAPDSVLHGTSVSIRQHFTYGQENPIKLNVFDSKQMGENTVKPLPKYFSTMEHDVSLPKDEVVYIPALQDIFLRVGAKQKVHTPRADEHIFML